MRMSQKRLAASLLKCGITRVRISDEKKASEALTREDVRELINNDIITKVQKKGTSKKFAKIRLTQKNRGRQAGYGKRKGTKNARAPKKRMWIKVSRPLRRLLRELRDNGQIDKNVYKELYMKVHGGMFRNKSHLLYYLKEHELLKGSRPKKPKKAKSEKKAEQKKAEVKETDTKKG